MSDEEAEAWALKERKIEQAKKWVERSLREEGGPLPGLNAVMVICAVPLKDAPDTGTINVGCLPDMEPDMIIAGLEQWIANLKAGVISQTPHGLDDVVEEIKQ